MRDIVENTRPETPRYFPYHTWVRADIIEASGDDVNAEWHMALGRYYWSRLEANYLDERGLRHCSYHLAQSGVENDIWARRLVRAVCQSHTHKRVWGLDYDLEGELAAARRIIDDSSTPPPDSLHIEVLNASVHDAIRRGKTNECAEYCEALMAYAERLRPAAPREATDCMALALSDTGDLCLALGRPDDALGPLREAHRLYGTLGGDLGQLKVNTGIAHAHALNGDFKAALELHAANRHQWLQRDKPVEAAQSLFGIGRTHDLSGEHQQAADEVERALLEFQSHGADGYARVASTYLEELRAKALATRQGA
jgi:hypothetical protein